MLGWGWTAYLMAQVQGSNSEGSVAPTTCGSTPEREHESAVERSFM